MSEDISNIKRYTNTRSQVRNLIKEFNLSRTLSVPTETLDYYRQQIDLDGNIQVTDDNGFWTGTKKLGRGYYLPFEPDLQKLALWHKLNAPFSISVDSSGFQRNGVMNGIPVPINSYDNGLAGSIRIATGFDGVDDWATIPHYPEPAMHKVKEGFTYHIKFAPCDIKLQNGQPVTLYAKKEPASPKGFVNSIISVLLPEGHVASKLSFEGKEYTAVAYDFFEPDNDEDFGITRWYDHTIRFSRINEELDLLLDNQPYNAEWDDAHLTPYPVHDIDWHLARSTFLNRGLFWGGLGDFRYYWDLWFTNQHSSNFFNNRITISNIPYGRSAVIGHSYITHSTDLGTTAGFLHPLANGKGFIKPGGKWLFLSEPVTRDFIPVWNVKTYPTIERDISINWNIDYTAPVTQSWDIRWNLAGDASEADGKVTQDFIIAWDILATGSGGGGGGGGQNNQPPVGVTCPIGWTWDAIAQICKDPNPPPTGGGGTQTPTQPALNLGFVGDTSGSSAPPAIYDSMKAKGVKQLMHIGDFSYGSSATSDIAHCNRIGADVAGTNALWCPGNHDHPNEDGNATVLSQQRSYFGYPSGTLLNKSKQVLNVYLISMNTQDPDFDSNTSEQYLWVQSELVKAKALKDQGKVAWIIVGIHKPFYTNGGGHRADEEGGRGIYQALFTTYGVDFVFHGHNHLLQISKPLGNNGQVLGTQNTDGTWDFTKAHGQFYLTVGNGGRSAHDAGSANAGTWLYNNDSTFGWTQIAIDTTGLNITVTSWNTTGSTKLYEFKVTKGGTTGGGGTPVGDPVCQIGYTWSPTQKRCNANVVNPPPPAPSEAVIWDSNLILINGTNYTVTDTHGNQADCGKGIYMAASGDPRTHVKADGTFILEADAGHGRIYAKACNYNARLEGEVKFNTASIDNTTWKLRNRHDSGGDCENRFGGIGAHLSRTEAGTQIEKCHNTHEPSFDTPLPKSIALNAWVGFKFSVQDTPTGGINQKIEIDYKDGEGFRVVHNVTMNNPPAYYKNKALFLQESSFWMRINNESTGSVTYKNVKMYNLDATTTNPPPPTNVTGINQAAAFAFLRNSYNSSLQLLEEAPGFATYWLWNDQLLGQILLKHVDPAMAQAIENKMNSFGVPMRTPWATLDSQYRANFSIKGSTEPTISTNPHIRYSDYNTGGDLPVTQFADIAFLKCIHEYYLGNIPAAQTAYNAGRAFWNGQGMDDNSNITGEYAVYKIALGMLAEKVTGFTPSIGIPNTFFAPFQHANGGIITDKTNGQPDGSQNIETTCAVLLALNPSLLIPPTGPSPNPTPDPGNNTGGVLDTVTGIKWLQSSGEIGEVIAQSRDQANDFRWSEVFPNLREFGYEVTAYFTFSGVSSGGHWALKFWGGNHSGSCQYSESGSCCCWYDLGIRADGSLQLQIERPHPSNDDFSLSETEKFMSNIGESMNGNTIGLKWLVYPIQRNGDVDNGGMRIKMWVDTDGLGGDGKPQNHWRLVVNFKDTGQVLGDYPAPAEQEIESRNSDTNDTESYLGGLHWRRRNASDFIEA